MATCDGASLNVHDVGWPPKDDSKRCRFERLVDFDTPDVTVAPAGPRKGLSDHRDRAKAEQIWLDRCTL